MVLACNMTAASIKVEMLLLISLAVAIMAKHSRPRGMNSRMESLTTCFLAEYAKTRQWEEVVLFLKSSSGMTDLVMGMNRRDILVGLKYMNKPQLPAAVTITRHRLGAVVFFGSRISPSEEEFLEQVSQEKLYQTYISWLFVLKRSPGVVDVKSTVEEKLRLYNLALDTDLIVATMTSKDSGSSNVFQNSTAAFGDNTSKRKFLSGNTGLSDNIQGEHHKAGGVYQAKTTTRIDGFHKKYDEKHMAAIKNTDSERMKDQHNANQSDHSAIFWLKVLDETVNASSNDQVDMMNNRVCICVDHPNHKSYAGIQFKLTQVYKIRSGYNISLITLDLGFWEANRSSATFVQPSGIEERNNLYGYPLLVGIRNISQSAVAGAATGSGSEGTAGIIATASLNGAPAILSNILDEDTDDDSSLMDILEYITKSVNSSYELVPFAKLGWKNEEGAWLYLLGAVTQGTVDLGLDNVVITEERTRDMFFTLPIVQSMKNIYFQRPDSSALRDIFLAPFSPRLLVSVALTGIILSLAMLVINIFTTKRISADVYESAFKCFNKKREGNLNFGEAIIWSVSVLCMQGSPWSPKSPSGSFVLIFSLFFALIIYNAYAAFITSVLSVRVASIRELEDLLESDFQFSYTLGGQDEAFLRTVNDSALRRLYFRGLVHNHGVEEASEGLVKASHGGYAFFVSARLARKAFNTFIAQDKRCDIQELYVEATKSSIALPMGIGSPYRKLINLSLLKMREEGILGYMQRKMLPSMPYCQAYSAFNSASITDVYSAFLLLGGGLTAAFGLGLLENIWKRKLIWKGLLVDGEVAIIRAAVQLLP